MSFNGISSPNANVPSVHSRVLSLPFGIHSSLVGGIPTARLVSGNTEPNNFNESLSDNGSVGFNNTPDSTATPLGVVIDGCTNAYSNVRLLPGSNRDFNVTICLLGTALVECVLGAVVTQGGFPIFDPNDGRLVTTNLGGFPSANNFRVLKGTNGSGTASNPKYAIVLVR